VDTLLLARSRKSYGVYDCCRELLQGYEAATRAFVEAGGCMKAGGSEEAASTGQQRPRLATDASLGQVMEAEGQTSLDGELNVDCHEGDHDTFQRVMGNFLASSHQEAHALASLCSKALKTYWQLAVFFEDPSGVYPPPQQDSDATEDLVGLIHGLTEAVAKAVTESEFATMRKELELLASGAGSQQSRFGHELLADASDSPEGSGLGQAEASGLGQAEEAASAGSAAGLPSVPSPCCAQQHLDAVALQRLRSFDQPDGVGEEEEQSDVSDWEGAAAVSAVARATVPAAVAAASAVTTIPPAAAAETPATGRACMGQQTCQGLLPLPLPEVPPSPATSLVVSIPDGSPQQAWHLLFTPTADLSPAGPQFHIGQHPLQTLPEVPPLPSTTTSGGGNSSCINAVPTASLQLQQKQQQPQQQPQQQWRQQQDLPTTQGGRERCRKSLSRVVDRVASAALSSLVESADSEGSKASSSHERPLMLAEQLKAEVRRRSLS